MSSIFRVVLVCTFIVSLNIIYVSKSLWAASCCGNSKGSAHATQTQVKDPVCGMEISNIKKAPSKKYQGKVYYFCSKNCKKNFKKDPASYTLTETP